MVAGSNGSRDQNTSKPMTHSKKSISKISEVFLYLVRIGIGCMFIWSSLPKIRQPYDFLSSVYSYELVGPKLGMFIAMTLPWLELLVGICLIGGIFISGALLASIAMAAMFTLVLGSALHNGLEIACGCFGAGPTDIITYNTWARAGAILLLSVIAYLCNILLPSHS
jgi:putative oxidoreductase